MEQNSKHLKSSEQMGITADKCQTADSRLPPLRFGNLKAVLQYFSFTVGVGGLAQIYYYFLFASVGGDGKNCIATIKIKFLSVFFTVFSKKV
jgi:hypothetical protein